MSQRTGAGRLALRRRRHLPFYAAAAIGIAALLIGLVLPASTTAVIAANAFFGTYLLLTLRLLPRLTAEHLKARAADNDAPVWVIFAVTIGAVIVAIVSLFIVLNSREAAQPLVLVLALLAVPLGWMTIHLMAAIHYAHLYWQPGATAKARHRGGLEFPGTPAPDGGDFVYFAFVIGMTAQTSDVAITDSGLRRINVVHAIVSFFFNTVLVAAAVNLAVSLG